MRIGTSGKVKVGQGDIVRLIGGLLAVITSVVVGTANALVDHKVTINALAKTDAPNVFNRITITPDAIEAVQTPEGTWITRTGDPFIAPAPQTFSEIMNERETYAKDHNINIADIGTNRDPGSPTYAG